MKLVHIVILIFCFQLTVSLGQLSIESNFLAINPLNEFGVNINRDLFFGSSVDVLYRLPKSENIHIGFGYSYSKYDEGHHISTTTFTPVLIAMVEELKTNVSMQNLTIFGRYNFLNRGGKFKLFGELDFGLNYFLARKKSMDLYFKNDSNGDGVINSSDEKIPKNETNLPETINTNPSKAKIQHQDISPCIGIGIGCKSTLYKNLSILIKASYIYGFEASYFDDGSNTQAEKETDYWKIVNSKTSVMRFAIGFGWEF